MDLTNLIISNRKKFWEGTIFRKIEILEYIGSSPKNFFAMYKCKCSVCGDEFISPNTRFTKMHYEYGCSKCTSIQLKIIKRENEPTLYERKAKKSWYKIKERCYNPKDISYKSYGAIGIFMEDRFKNNFKLFYNEIGDPPELKNTWSVDRIDNRFGYISGNLRWAHITTQARNKRMVSTNNSGFTGVQLAKLSRTLLSGELKSTTYAISTWSDPRFNQKTRNKKFSVDKFGLLPAFYMACEYRKLKIKELCDAGFVYSENHGIS